ncbi:MAG: hypothetical protein ACKD6N_04495 [Candidatus Bathyarchaeota archaeon]
MFLSFIFRKKENPPPPKPAVLPESIKVEKSLTREEYEKIKNELKILNLEREILSESLTRIYEAAAEGRITEEEKVKLLAKYEGQISKLNDTIEHNQRIVSLYELEETRVELVKMFTEKFMEINNKIEEVRKKLGLTPKEFIEHKILSKPTTTTTPTTTTREAKTPIQTEKPQPRKSKADEELEKLKEELQKELEKLEQIELEG